MRPALGGRGRRDGPVDARAVDRIRPDGGRPYWWRMGDRDYSFDTVAQVAAEMAKYDIAWLEEPLPPDNHEAYCA